jgi:type VI protein secretion system component Hcp
MRSSVRHFGILVRVVGMAVGIAVTAPAFADQGFLRIPGIEGESVASAHPREIVVLGYHWGRGGGATGLCENFAIDKYIDKATPLLLTAAASAQVLPDSKLFIQRLQGGTFEDYLTFTLSSPVVAKVVVGGVLATGQQMETVELTPLSVTVEYKAQLPTGGTSSVVSQVNCPQAKK